MPADPVTSPLFDLIARLREVEGKATKGPWVAKAHGIEARAFDGSWKWLTPTIHAGTPSEATASRALIAEARNALPILLSVIEEYRRALAEIPCSCVDDMNAHDDKHDWCALNIAKQAIARAEAIAAEGEPNA